MSRVRSVDRPLLACGTARLALEIEHHKQQCRPAMNRKSTYNIFYCFTSGFYTGYFAGGGENQWCAHIARENILTTPTMS